MKNTQLMHERAELFARSIVANQKGFNFETIFEYTDENGDVIYWKLRAKNPVSGEKFIRSFSEKDGGFVLKEPDFNIVFSQGKSLLKSKQVFISKTP